MVQIGSDRFSRRWERLERVMFDIRAIFHIREIIPVISKVFTETHSHFHPINPAMKSPEKLT